VKKILINIGVFAIVIAVMITLLLSLGSDQGAKYVYKNNTAHKIIKIKPKEYQCSECNMNIDNLDYMIELIMDRCAQSLVYEKGFVSYDEMKLLMLQGKNLHDPFVKKKLLGK